MNNAANILFFPLKKKFHSFDFGPSALEKRMHTHKSNAVQKNNETKHFNCTFCDKVTITALYDKISIVKL